jgi:RNA polymerase-binding transcription factor DksA
MNEQQRQAHRARLLALGQRLRSDLAALRGTALRGIGAASSGNLSNVPHHLADLANDTFEQEVDVGLLENEQQVLRAIAAALDRIDDGTFGRCLRCEKAIPEGRLKALPYASRCVRCEEKAEQEQRARA